MAFCVQMCLCVSICAIISTKNPDFEKIFFEVQMGYKKMAIICKQRKVNTNEKPAKMLVLRYFNRFVCYCVVFCPPYLPMQKITFQHFRYSALGEVQLGVQPFQNPNKPSLSIQRSL